ncbi:hypothetical protein NBH19_03330 [Rhizobium sp. S95]|uniref:Uncharacterized protein n=1 Tax=Ciceribacter sichuanensis TaxID=2949647 RepID=A0AAJ1FH24_9HYPH|nr:MULTISPECIES: hypothetical protein [unclassified Ciceribacter]MCM2395114.1 hypothetical protein [Ciceribacter sp. S95]MCO5955536.1 hypothetical protein [Ciceribacter sp. S101]
MKKLEIGSKVRLVEGITLWGANPRLHGLKGEVIENSSPDGVERVTVKFEDGSIPFQMIYADLFIRIG